jgi:prevent-host-death family protein
LETAATHLAELADEVESSGGRIRLTRDGHPDLLLISADDLDSLQETMFWYGDALDRAAEGELPGEGEEGPGLDESQVRELYEDLLRRHRSATS